MNAQIKGDVEQTPGKCSVCKKKVFLTCDEKSGRVIDKRFVKGRAYCYDHIPEAK